VIPVNTLAWLATSGYPDLTNSNSLAIAFTVLQIFSLALTCWFLYSQHKAGWYTLFSCLFALCCNLVAWISYCILLGTEYNGGVLESQTVGNMQYVSGISGIWSAGFAFAIANTPFLIVLCSMIAFTITNKPQSHSLTSTYHIQMKHKHDNDDDDGMEKKQYDSQEAIPEGELQNNHSDRDDIQLEDHGKNHENDRVHEEEEEESNRHRNRRHRHRGRRDDDQEEDEDVVHEDRNVEDAVEEEDRGRNKRRQNRNAVI
jgi:hypothetical protein